MILVYPFLDPGWAKYFLTVKASAHFAILNLDSMIRRVFVHFSDIDRKCGHSMLMLFFEVHCSFTERGAVLRAATVNQPRLLIPLVARQYQRLVVRAEALTRFAMPLEWMPRWCGPFLP